MSEKVKQFLGTAEVTDREIPLTEMFLNIGPQHPSMHGVCRIMIRVEGEKILWSEVEIGYMHRAFEKHCEAESWNTAIPYTDRLNYVSPVINNVGYCMAVEKLLGVTVPERGEYLRTLVSEVARISDHLTNIAAQLMELGAFTVFLYCMKAREWCYEVFEAACGARVTTNFTRVGGLIADAPQGFDELVKYNMPLIRGVVDELDKLITRNRIFIDRVKDISALTPEEAIALGFTGPCLRATGVPFDVRRTHPYSIYDRLEFTIPVGTNGDVLDRYLVRMEEMRQSLLIVDQCLQQMQPGPVNVLDRTITRPKKSDVYSNIEALMNQFKLVMKQHGIKPPPGETYSAVEGGNGEVGFFVVSEGGDGPWKCRCRAPSFPLVQALPYMLQDHYVADIVPVFGSINYIAGEVER